MVQPYEILIDATCDIPEAYRAEIDVLPMAITAGNESSSYRSDWDDAGMAAFYGKLRGGLAASTSQITPYLYEETFERSIREGRGVLCFCFSSGMSGSFASALVAADAVRARYPGCGIEVVDSKNATFGEGLAVKALIENRAAGLSMEENARRIREAIGTFAAWFTVEDLLYLKRGGRISALTAILGTALRVMPVLHIDDDGRLVIVDKVQGRKAALRSLVKRVRETWSPELDETIWVAHSDALPDAEMIAALLRGTVPEAQVAIGPLSPIIGVHTGPGMVSVFFRTHVK